MSTPNTITFHPKYDRIEPKAAAGESDLNNMFDAPTPAEPEPLEPTREEDEGLVF